MLSSSACDSSSSFSSRPNTPLSSEPDSYDELEEGSSEVTDSESSTEVCYRMPGKDLGMQAHKYAYCRT